MIEIESLHHRFGDLIALDGLDFRVGPGEVVGFLGPNGAGKTTTMKLLTGYLAPTSGRIRVFGRDLARHRIEVQRRLGYLPEGAPAWGDMTPRGLIRFVGRVRGMDPRRFRERSALIRERLGLDPVFDRPLDTLSRGFRRRVGLALALLDDPELLILDEPTDGLDPNQKHEVRELIAELRGERIVIVSTHILEEVEAVCSRALIIHRGRLVADATPRELLRRSRWHGAVSVHCTEPFDGSALLSGLPGVDRVEAADEQGLAWTLFTRPGDAGQDTLHAVRDQGAAGAWPLDELHLHPGRLDDVFRRLTSDPAPAAPQPA
jgi:ABC-2 type transport system ATP-binding protein